MTEEEKQAYTRYFIDCEFDGHNGSLLSMAIVRDDGEGIHIETTETATYPWVVENVIPYMTNHEAQRSVRVDLNKVGGVIRAFIGQSIPTIIADSPVDIARFCTAISTDGDGHWSPTDYARMTFEVHNVDCYPTELEGACQHNAWWDAMALRHVLINRSEASHAAVVAELLDALDDAQEFARHQGYREVSDEWKAIVAKHKGGRDER